ncbi:sensor domain-containing protein [Clostridium akagii]|uniref:sensor domain-containing protein n=1 Tax=Clostridium akagii TaxID=91623 RepID=UPI00068AD869|nr:EAL domain-containing protein [Clostridium akagii]
MFRPAVNKIHSILKISNTNKFKLSKIKLLRKIDLLENEAIEIHEKLVASNRELHNQINELHITNNKLIESKRRLNRAQVIGKIGNWEFDLINSLTIGSAEAFKIYGVSTKDGILSLDYIKNVVVPEDRSKMDTALKLLIEENLKYDIEFRIERKDNGERRHIHSVAEVEYDINGKALRVLGVIQDITAKKTNEIILKNNNDELSSLYEQLAASDEELKQQLDEIILNKELLDLSEEKYKTIVNNSQNIIYSCTVDGIFITVNNKFSQFTNIPENKIIGKNINDIVCASAAKELETNIKKVVNSRNTIKFENKYNEDTIFTVTLSPIFDMKNNVIGVTGTNHDITESKKSEQIIRRMAYYDDLTDLPNRTFFFDKLEKELQIAKEAATKLVVLFLDMDNFKRVNDSLGHSFGDELLKEASVRLKRCMRGSDTVARISGDEFAVLLQNVDDTNGILPIIDGILSVFNETFHIENSSINITSSIGVSVFPDDGSSPDDLIKSADIAMYRAKDLGKNKYQFFNIHMKNELVRKINIEVLLRKAIQKKEFILYYQPQFDVNTQKIRGLEALIRWNSPELGFMNPLEFISIAEEAGLISLLGDWVLNTACNFAKKINDIYSSDIIMAVNISPIQLKLGDFYDNVIATIIKSGINPCDLELEVTENVLIDNFDFALDIFKNLKKSGIKLSLDDFGTGYSSLSYLKKLPIDLLKIDKSFVDEINISNHKNDFIESIISLIHKLDIKALAEGVEDKFQYDYLKEAGIDHIQGYYLGKPMPGEEVEKALNNIWTH